MTHTPGPWKVSATMYPKAREHLGVCLWALCETAIDPANADLLAAAPDLLAALRSLIEDPACDCESCALEVAAAEAAIAKAEGREP